MAANEADDKSHKKGRKRLKRLYQQIREQMEFYFSDANLQKDRFFKQQMSSSADGYIDLELFLKCNKIRAMTSDIDVLMKAVSTSQILGVKKEEKKVGRLIPFAEPKDVDDRTVYVECLPTGIDREWIRNMFSCCGTILYISLPRYKSTADIKGFAFVEFETKEAAEKACELMNHPPAEAVEKVGRFPRSKQLKQLEKQVQIQQAGTGRKRRASESEMDKEQLPKVKRKRTMSECKSDEVEHPIGSEGKSNAEEPLMKSKQSTKQESPAMKRKKRRSSEGDDALQGQASDGQSRIGETTVKQSKLKKDQKVAKQVDTNTEKRNSTKKVQLETNIGEPAQQEKHSTPKKLKRKEESFEAVTIQKRRAEDDGVESGEKKSKRVKFSEEPSTLLAKEEKPDTDMTEKPDEEDTMATKEQKKKRKKTKKNRNKTNAKEVPELRVLPKSEWLRLRSEYIQMQKTNMKQLKEKLKELKSDEVDEKRRKNGTNSKSFDMPASAPAIDPSDTRQKGEPEYTEGVIIKVTTEQPMTRKDVKERVGAVGSIAYIDVKDGDTCGYVRCNDRQTATAISETSVHGYLFQCLSGSDEQAYWQKLIEDRNKKLNTKTRTKQRGRDKNLHKADLAYEKMKKPLHIFFD